MSLRDARRHATLVLFAACALRAGVARAETGWMSEGRDVAVHQPLVILPTEVVDHDVLEIAGDVTVYGIVHGDVVALCGNVHVFGRVEGSVLAVAGRVRLDGGLAVVDRDATAIAGSVDVTGGQVGGVVRTALPLAPGERPRYLSVMLAPQVLVLRLLLVAFWTLLALVAAVAAPGALVRASMSLRGRLPALVAIGALFHVSVLLTAVLFTALVVVVVGVPLLGLLVAAFTLFESLALATAFHHVGERILERRAPRRTSGYASILLGALVVSAASFVPVAGEIAWLVASCAGAGALLATWRRQPAHVPAPSSAR